MSGPNLRRHRRIPHAGPVHISWQGADGVQRYAQGRFLDISEGGARLESPEPVPVRALLSLNAERLKISGAATVRHISRRGSKYLLGLELSSRLMERTLLLASEASNGDVRADVLR